MKSAIIKADVQRAIQALASQGKKTAFAALHAALDNRGSMSTLVRLKAKIEAGAQPVTDSPEALKAFGEIWSLAVEEGRKKREAVLLKLKETNATLAVDNEHLEGALAKAQDQVKGLERAKLQTEAELNQIRVRVEAELAPTRAVLSDAATKAAAA